MDDKIKTIEDHFKLVTLRSDKKNQKNNGNLYPYQVLGVEKNASKSDIKKKYHKQSLLFHPDKVESLYNNTMTKAEIDKKKFHQKKLTPEETKFEDHWEKTSHVFQEISNAFQILSDDEKRSDFDKYGAREEQFPPPPPQRPAQPPPQRPAQPPPQRPAQPPPGPKQFEDGARVKIIGLKTAKYNNVYGTLKNFDIEKGRWYVKIYIDKPEEILLKQENLQLVQEDPEPPIPDIELFEGAHVQLHGLTHNSILNGSIGIIKEKTGERWIVVLVDGSQYKLLSKNLSLVQPQPQPRQQPTPEPRPEDIDLEDAFKEANEELSDMIRILEYAINELNEDPTNDSLIKRLSMLQSEYHAIKQRVDIIKNKYLDQSIKELELYYIRVLSIAEQQYYQDPNNEYLFKRMNQAQKEYDEIKQRVEMLSQESSNPYYPSSHYPSQTYESPVAEQSDLDESMEDLAHSLRVLSIAQQEYYEDPGNVYLFNRMQEAQTEYDEIKLRVDMINLYRYNF
jgi:curved DNA-binding protein CbpA